MTALRIGFPTTVNVVYYVGFAFFGAIAFVLGRRIAAAGKRQALVSYGVVLALLLIKAVGHSGGRMEFSVGTGT